MFYCSSFSCSLTVMMGVTVGGWCTTLIILPPCVHHSNIHFKLGAGRPDILLFPWKSFGHRPAAAAQDLDQEIKAAESDIMLL